MDLSGNPELQQIFREEVSERATNLVRGARIMQEHDLSPTDVVDRRRDAHTIKGNALVMGYPHMGEAAKLLEDLLRDIDGGQRGQSPELGKLIGSIAEQFTAAVDTELVGIPELLNKAADRLRSHLGLSPLDPNGPGGSDLKEEELASASEAPSTENVVSLPSEPRLVAEPPNLGGLVETLESQIGSEMTRVESAKLYRLINRVVELRLDAEAVLRGLSNESAQGAPPVRLADASDEWSLALLRLDQAAKALETDAIDLASTPLVEVTRSFSQLVTFLARRTGKEVRMEIIGDDVAVDRQIIDALREPLRHLVVNAVDHGIELPDERSGRGKPTTATLLVRAHADENMLTVTVSDDGRGIDWAEVRAAAIRLGMTQVGATNEMDLTRLLFTPKFSTVGRQGEISGDGAGLAAAAELAQALNGSISLETSPAGTSVTLTLPRSLALQQILVVDVAGQRWGIPETSVLGVIPIDEPVVEIEHIGEMISVVSFADAVGVPPGAEPSHVVVLATHTGASGFSVDDVVGARRVVVKALGPLVSGAAHLSGAAFLGGGDVVVVVAPDELAERAESAAWRSSARPRVLVVDDSRGVRQVVEATLVSDGFEVVVAEDADAALAALGEGGLEALIVDYHMPGSDGVEVVIAVRRMFPTMPVVMVSGVADAEDQSRAHEAGVDAYLDKSDLRRGALVSTLRGLLIAGGVRNEVAQ